MKIRKNAKTVAVAALGTALVASMGAGAVAGSAFASGQATPGTTSWNIPTSPMTNTVQKDDGKTYKVITTWANAWATSGPDYLGISNSGTLDQQGGSDTAAKDATQSSLLGVWASAANEVPNAYNYNYLYNLYANSDAGIAAGAVKSDSAALNVSNGASPGYDSESGVWKPLKYRPEILYNSNSFKVDAINKYVGQIQSGEYHKTADDELTDEEKAAFTQTNGRATWGTDSSYSPKITTLNNANPYTFVKSFYTLANLAEQVETETSNYTSDATKTDWVSVNTLPRTTRYESTAAERQYTATECATNVEKVARASVYYTLSKIADGTTSKKKVAFLTEDPTEGKSTVTAVAFDFTENMSGQGAGGAIGFAAMCVDQLTSNDVVAHGGDDSVTGTGSDGDNPYTTYTVTADQVADCDVIVDLSGGINMNGKNSYNSANLKDWVVNNATGAHKTKAKKASYLASVPTVIQTHNYTSEKLLWNAYVLNYIYPDLFPNMELVTYWYDDIYHLKTEYLYEVMGWTFANADKPAGTDFATSTYNWKTINAKFAAGYQYYKNSKSTDKVLKRLVAGKCLSTSYYKDQTFKSFSNLIAPTSELRAWAEDFASDNSSAMKKLYTPAKASVKSVKAAKKSVTVKVNKTAGATGYQIKYTVKGGKAATATTTSTSKTVKGLKSGKKYTVKVRAYKKVNGKTYYGSYSAAKTVKVK